METKKLSSKEILKLASDNQKRAWEVIEKLRVIELWEKYGMKINLVGSLYSGLLMKHKDIDFHIYSDKTLINDGFKVMAEMALNPSVKTITYGNLLDTDEQCVEWHLWFEDEQKELWQIDMIHILNESIYAGKIEHTTQRIKELLTPEMKLTILTIKNDKPDDEQAMGIEYYRAVIEAGVKTYEEFREWKKQQPPFGPLDWIP